ncbi:MAG TPA: AprI/Inh family metalloprotease inhibitor [Rhizomicrobium sp.]|nr:AprI/Inh family metalloprotease inhibitor [Rhizomicrobium sp.]
MIAIRALTVAAGLALAGISIAQADTALTGAWKMTVGQTACTLTLSADSTGAGGSAAAGPECPGGLLAIGQWKTVGASLQLLSPSGNLVALLKPKGDAYEGTRIEDGRKVALSR